ncbi:MAG: hypothetical protein KF755_12720 [Burkholderiaceae bacterium]|nr:hypothetical protein [Burkholderiaceae bacterium]
MKHSKRAGAYAAARALALTAAAPSFAAGAIGGGASCTIATGDVPFGPTLPLLVAPGIAGLGVRRAGVRRAGARRR